MKLGAARRAFSSLLSFPEPHVING
jgi:hypothetical protein